MKKTSSSTCNREAPFQCKVEPLDDIQFDCDEEIKVPILVELRHEDAEVPKKSHRGSSCYDLKSLETHRLWPKRKHIFDLGLAFKMKKGWKLEIYNRSGLSTVNNIEIPGTPKVIDNDYRGNVFICLKNTGDKGSHTIKKGDRIGQLAVVRSYPIDFIRTKRIDPHETSRGTGCYGSTGR